MKNDGTFHQGVIQLFIQSQRLICMQFSQVPYSSWYDRKKNSASKPSPNKGLDASKSSSAPINDELGDDDFDDFDPRGSAKSGKSLLAG